MDNIIDVVITANANALTFVRRSAIEDDLLVSGKWSAKSSRCQGKPRFHAHCIPCQCHLLNLHHESIETLLT